MTCFATALPEIEWPAVPSSYSSGLLAVLFQLDISQWQTIDELAQQQFSQLAHVVRHACNTVPYYAQLPELSNLANGGPIDAKCWLELPLLTRRTLQTSFSELQSSNPPEQHGPVTHSTTSGSTNAPVSMLGTGVTDFFWRAFTLREHFWHRRKFNQPLAAIRHSGLLNALPPNGHIDPTWGSATTDLISTGAAHLLDVKCSVEDQARWLTQVNPGYILGYPSALVGVGRVLHDHGWHLPNLLELRTFGEILESETRQSCSKLFGTKVVDMYSSQEVGYIALQCPSYDHYHVQSENLIIEILNESGKPCQPGEIGKVVATTLHNFAMPLLRYDIGDFAEVGNSCPCGRGLPVLKRILGRQRNLLVFPDGSRHWPVFDRGEHPDQLPSFFQFQVIQRNLNEIEVLAVRSDPFTPEENARVVRYMQQTLGFPFAIQLRRVDQIPRNRNGKFEDFICEVPQIAEAQTI